MSSTRKSLVTGGAGFIGRHLVRRLLADSAGPVAVIDNLSRCEAGSERGLPQDVEFHRADILDRRVLLEAMKGTEVVYHLAAVSSVGAAQDDFGNAYRINVQGTAAVLQAARECGVRRVIFSSSREVYGEPARLPVPETLPLQPKSAYGLTKASGESCCHLAESVEVAVLRLANVYGPGDHGRVIPIFLRNAILGRQLKLFGGEQILDFIWIDFVVDALVRAADAPIAGAVNIGSGIGVALPDLARRILDISDSDSHIEFAPKKPFEVSRFVADTAAARRILNLEPVTDPLFELASLAQQMKKQLLHSVATA